MIDYLAACKALMITVNLPLKMHKELGHEKLHQWSAAVVRLLHVHGKFSNMMVSPALQADRPGQFHHIGICPESCKILGSEDPLNQKTMCPIQLRGKHHSQILICRQAGEEHCIWNSHVLHRQLAQC